MSGYFEEAFEQIGIKLIFEFEGKEFMCNACAYSLLSLLNGGVEKK